MKKVINNKLYNTESARELGTWSNMADVRNFSWYCETLYQKRTGEYFLHGEGGPMTQYAETIGQNSWSGGQRIMPLSVEKAREWAEEHLDADEYMEIFGEPGEDDALENLYVQLPADLMARMRREASENGYSLRGYVEHALRVYMETRRNAK